MFCGDGTSCAGCGLALTYDIDTPRTGFVHVGQQNMVRVQNLVDAAPVDQVSPLRSADEGFHEGSAELQIPRLRSG